MRFKTSAGKGVRSSTDALLQRASSQLRGEKPKREEDHDDGLGAYLSGLSEKPAPTQEIQWDKYGDSDLSEDDQDKPFKATTPAPSGASKFLKKKKPATAMQDEKTTSNQNTNEVRAKYLGSTKKQTSASHPIAQSKSSALNKVAAFTNKYESKGPREVAPLSESDMDMSLSMDDDILRDVQNLRPAASAGPAVKTRRPIRTPSPDTSSEGLGKGGSRFMKKPKPTPAAAPVARAREEKDDDDDSSVGLGRGGSKFVKKKTTFADEKTSASSAQTTAKPGNKSKPSMFSLKSAEKYSTQVILDTDEESMAEYIKGMSSDGSPGEVLTPRSPKTPRGILKTPRTPRTVTPTPMEDITEEDEDNTAHSDLRDEVASDVESDASFKNDSDSIQTDLSDQVFNVNLMDLDSLEPAMPVLSSQTKPTSKQKKTKEKEKKAKQEDKTKAKNSSSKSRKAEPEDDIFLSLGLQTVDDLLKSVGDQSDQEISEASEMGGVTSEIKTEADDYQYESDFDPASRSARSPTPLRSILSPTPRTATPRSARGRVRYSLQEVTEIRSRSPSPEVISTARGSQSHASIVYTEDFDDESASEIATATVRTEYESDSESSVTDRRGQRSHRSRKDSEDYYSDDFTSATDATSRRYTYSRSSSHDSDVISYTDSFTSYAESSSRSRTPSPDRKPRTVKTRSANVQTGLDLGDLVYQWNSGASAMQGPSYGLTGLDPSPIATHVVGADALEALTAYSPSVIALNDMLRQQLQLTTQFVESQKRLHQNLVSQLQPERQYTTLEDTKRYIKKHRKKTLSFEEALKQVKQEMDLV